MPEEGLNPVTPHIAAGILMEHPVSDPVASKAMLDARAAAEPPLDPPGILSIS